jgi:hypothetical protein
MSAKRGAHDREAELEAFVLEHGFDDEVSTYHPWPGGGEARGGIRSFGNTGGNRRRR